ncbi:MAG TPA: TA system VapC family ribonuclease toxin [Gemmatimonadaceae bacterium]
MFVVDTNILIYATDRRSPFHDGCRVSLERWRRQTGPWYLTWGIVYEYLRVVTHPRVLARPLSLAQAWSFIDSLLASPGMEVLLPTIRHVDVLRQIVHELPQLSGNIMHDAETATLMHEHGIKVIISRDVHFHRFPFLERRDPIDS